MPPREESLRQSGEWIVVSETPDICLTPIGGIPVPIPYAIIARGANTCDVAAKTNFTTQPVFHHGSHLQCVEGDEAGVLGGIISGVNCGVCYPIKGSPTVNIEGNPLLRHDDPFAMNAATYGSPGNAIGYAVWVETPDVKDSEDSVPWYKSAYSKAKKKLDEINQDFKKAEKKFGQSVKNIKNILETDPGAINQPLGEAAGQFVDTIKDRGGQLVDSLKELPGRVWNDPGGYVEDTITGVSKGIPDAAGKFMDNMANGDIGKGFGGIVFDMAEGAVKGKATSRSAKQAIGKAKTKVGQAKSKVKAGQKASQKVNKSLKKTGGRIQGSPAKRAAKKSRRAALNEKKSQLQAENKSNLKQLEKAKSNLANEQANPNSYDYDKLIDLPSSPPEVECPDVVDGATQLYIGGPCDTSGAL